MASASMESLQVPSDFEDEDDFGLAMVEEFLKEGPLRPGRPKLVSEDAKKRKASLALLRKQKARAVVPVNLRAPRPLVVLRNLDWKKELVAASADHDDSDSDSSDTPTKVSSREEARLLLAEYCETHGANMVTTGIKKHAVSMIRPQTTMQCLRGVCASPSCPFIFDWVLKNGSW